MSVDDRLTCELCGRRYANLGGHVVRSHAMTVREYQLMHGLPVSRGLVSDSLRARHAARQRRIMAGPEGERLQAGIADKAGAAAVRDPEVMRRAAVARAPQAAPKIAATLRAKVPPLVCVVCGREHRPGDRRTLTCSPECRSTWQAQRVARGPRDPDRVARMRAMREAGASYAEIGRAYGITGQTVRHHLTQA
ncbi:ROS/MUCR transcriptional regulator protein [Salana multivorans]|uniref:ROS/MUCR transcriptional regulator protein n=1 Tax=Salana multivorans TaxID=120377 RepID=A0A3N2DDC0_9MICO|nr:MucR family transcriptional regulator [Salana multivorans]ROR97773.1 ROS/MUCR transcriptional regulator protein [Salana multivorans]ROR97852.1 ROS/MUCR transcriptional regulator protein [Salana multivorans]